MQYTSLFKMSAPFTPPPAPPVGVEFVTILDGKYRLYENGQIMHAKNGNFIKGKLKEGSVYVTLSVSNDDGPCDKIYKLLDLLMYEAFNGPVLKKTRFLHRNGDPWDCSIANIYERGTIDVHVMARAKQRFPPPDHAFADSPFSKYLASRAGQVFNAMEDNTLEGSVNPHGTVTLRIVRDDGKSVFKPKGRFIYWCFNKETFDIEDKALEVVHLDKDPENNALVNLKAVTHAERAKMSDKEGHARGGELRKRVVEELDGEEVTALYPGVAECISAIHVSKLALRDAMSTGVAIKGHTYRFAFPEIELPEVWFRIVEYEVPEWMDKSLQGLGGLMVSDFGRIVSPEGIVYNPTRRKVGSQAFPYNGVNRHSHRILTLAFCGLPPSPEHTPDHRNRDHSDNRSVNLRWLDKKEQASNMKSNVVVTRTDAETGEKTVYKTRSEAVRESGISMTHLQRVCAAGTVCKGATWSETKSQVEPEPEGTVAGHPDTTEPVSTDEVRAIVHRGKADI